MAVISQGFVPQAGEILNETVAANFLARAGGGFVDPASLGGGSGVVDLAYARLLSNATIVDAAQDLNFSGNQVGNIVNTNGVFTLLAGKTYQISANMYGLAFDQASTQGNVRVVDSANIQLPGTPNMILRPGADISLNGQVSSITFLINPSVNTNIKFRVDAAGVGRSFQIGQVESSITIIQVGSTATTNINPSEAFPATPTTGVSIYTETRWNPNGDLAYVNKSGSRVPLQRALRFNQTHWMSAIGNGTGTYSNGLVITATGTATGRNVAVTNLFTASRRLGYVSAATAGASAGVRHALAQYFRNNGLGLGGYRATMTFGVSGFQSTMRVFAGMTATTAALGNADPSTFGNYIAIIKDAGDTNYFLAHNDSAGTATKINLGTNFPVTASNEAWIRLTIVSVPSTAIYYYIENLSNNQVATGTITTDVPTNTTLLVPQIWANNNAVAAAVGIDFGIVCIDTLY
ncbi:MAG: hypothetical protein ACRDBG_13495 [Waterburya sp.]